MTLDDKIRNGLPISLNDFVRINNEAIKIHKEYIKRTDDTDATGTDLEHQFWIDFYEQSIEFVKGNPSSWTKENIVEKYKYDANMHLRVINEGLAGIVQGDVNWQSRWFYRWLACGEFVNKIVL
jgi:superfamily I DNA and/or RNA helicase